MEPGLRLGDWDVRGLLGAGSFGQVVLLQDAARGASLALKMSRWPKEVLQERLRANWTREVERMRAADHENLIRTLEVPEGLASRLAAYNPSGLPVLCSEFCGGGDLRQTLNRPENVNGLCEPEVRCLLNDLKGAVAYLHSLQITHRDLKPENIVLRPLENPAYERSFVYKLTDTGIAKDVGPDSICGNAAGPLQYFAPELFYAKTHTRTADYWSLGLIAFEAICGVRPFLPNMAPVQWMTHLKTKTPEQICAFENFNDEVEFSEEIFPENHISRRLKSSMERWLRSALEWDPKKRGQDRTVTFRLPDAETPAPDAEILSALADILNKKIITIYSAPTYEHLSYDIDDGTTVATLQTWIERDTKIEIGDHLLISYIDFSAVDPDRPVRDYWTDKSPIMLFFYRKNCTAVQGSKIKLSPRIRSCLEYPKMNLSHHHLLTLTSYAHHYISFERELYESYVRAAIIRLEYVKSILNELYNDHNRTEREIAKINEKNNLLTDIIAVGSKKIEEFKEKSNLKEMSQWISKVKSIQEDAKKLQDAWNLFSTRYGSASRRFGEIQSKELYNKQNNPELIELNGASISLIIALYATPKSERTQKKSCADAVKIIYKSLKIRERLLMNVDDQKAVQTITDIHIEVLKMTALIKSIEKNAESLSKDISALFIEKENILWNALAAQMNPKPVENGKNAPSSLTDFKIGEPVRSKAPVMYDDKMLELQALINENVKLRKESLDFIAKSQQTHQSMKMDLFSDLKFLDEE